MLLQRVFVDANVLFSRTLRDWLFLLRHETDGMFVLLTSRDVMAETQYRLRRAFPELPGGAVTDLHEKIEAAVDEIVREFSTDVDHPVRDRDDLHVHAAAVAGLADVLLTDDRGWTGVDTLPYEVFGCDAFFVLVDDSAAPIVERVADDQQRYWNGRPTARCRELPEALIEAGCPDFAERVRGHLGRLSASRPSRSPD